MIQSIISRFICYETATQSNFVGSSSFPFQQIEFDFGIQSNLGEANSPEKLAAFWRIFLQRGNIGNLWKFFWFIIFLQYEKLKNEKLLETFRKQVFFNSIQKSYSPLEQIDSLFRDATVANNPIVESIRQGGYDFCFCRDKHRKSVRLLKMISPVEHLIISDFTSATRRKKHHKRWAKWISSN